MNALAAQLAYVRKALINVATVAGSLLSLGLLAHPYDVWVASAIAVIGVITHVAVPNADAPGTTAAVETTAPVTADADPTDWTPAPVVTAAQAQATPPADTGVIAAS